MGSSRLMTAGRFSFMAVCMSVYWLKTVVGGWTGSSTWESTRNAGLLTGFGDSLPPQDGATDPPDYPWRLQVLPKWNRAANSFLYSESRIAKCRAGESLSLRSD